MASIVPHTVRGRVILLIVLAFLPSVALSWYGYRELRGLALEATEQELLRLAEVTSSDFERMVEEGRAMLFALAQVEEVGSYQRPQCDALLGRIMEASPRYTALAVIDPDGYRVCGAVTLENPLYLGDRSYVIRATGSRDFAVGDYQVGRITKRPTVGLAYPVYGEDGVLRSIVATTLDLTLLSEHASEAQLPDGASYTVADLSGTVLVRYPGAEQWLGESLPDDFPTRDAAPATALPALLEGRDLDGTFGLFAVTALERPGGQAVGYLALGIPEAAVTAGLDQVIGTNISLLIIAAAVLLVAAWAFGHYSILARTSAIMEAERRLAAGELSARTGLDYGDDELGRLARTFDEMAARIEERETSGSVPDG